MNPAGIVIAIAGVWIVSQVFAGNALERLKILQPKQDAGGSSGLPGADKVLPYLPGGDKNPAVPTFPDIFGSGLGGKYL